MSRQNRLAFLLGLLSAFAPLSIDMYLSSLPDIGRDMGVGIDGAQLTLAAYFLGLGTGQLVHGPLADRLGRRPPLFVGLVVYIIASALCAMATSIEALILLRLCQALAGCAGMVIARAVVRDVAHEIDPVKLMSRLMLIMGVAPILAPLMGGYLAAALGWRAIFWFLAGVGAVALVCCIAFLPETLAPEKRQRASVFAVLRSYLSLITDRRFLATAAVSGLTMGGMFAYIAGSPFVFISIYGVAPEHYGLFFGAGAAGFILMSQFGGRFAAQYGRDRVFTMGVAGVACCGAALTGCVLLGAPFLAVYAAIVLYIALLGVTVPIGSVLAITPFPHIAGTASALLGTLQFGFGAIAGSLVSALHNGTALPMAITLGLAGVSAIGARLLLTR
ncbi:Bcr/CflA family multidrug efflux MFS transporter [Roseococcus sp. SYP-B2431]|uniref:Bcr/CflA family multidrug efflux MFS transporter n=1 Tax=Roseococcus sp. SYP-B2431 TaxID=2496640 RepID=UPI0010395A90|nr:Bcr/CflA family multidrug efflux MFS transporter [Roseococcus sp. SYP-B2431]TCH97068.1 Bcr/CflA family multidrug efflux MFS transporter [Roseococcus sp. SYP-B2431]